MIRRPPRSTQSRSSAASDVYKRQILPSSNASSSIVRAGTDTCCSLPLVSVNRKSTYFTPLSLIILITSLADIDPPYIYANAWRQIYYKYARKHGLLKQNPCHVVSS